MQEGQSLLREHSRSSAAGVGAQGVAMGTPAAPAAGNTRPAAQLSEALAEQRRLIRPIVLEFGTSSLPALPRAAQHAEHLFTRLPCPGGRVGVRDLAPRASGGWESPPPPQPQRPLHVGSRSPALGSQGPGRAGRDAQGRGQRRAPRPSSPRHVHAPASTAIPRVWEARPVCAGASPAARHGGVAHRRAGGSTGMNPHGSEVAVWAGDGFWVEPRGRHACPCV